MSAYGLSPVENVDNAPAMARALEQIREKCEENQTIVVTLPKGRYEFYPDSAAERVYFISNHDQMNPKKVGLPFEGMKNMVFDGQGSELIFHGRMLPVSLLDSRNCVLKNFSIDFKHPQISQVKVVENDTLKGGITFGSAIAGLSASGGLGLLVLVKENKDRKETGLIIGLLVLISLAAGVGINFLMR